MSHSIQIRNILVVPSLVSGQAPFHGWLEVRDGVIAGIGRGRCDQPLCDEIIDGEGAALIPGLINLHAHSHSSLTRGSAEGAGLEEWISMVEAEQQNLTEEEAYVGALATYGEALLSGTTTIMDMCLFPAAAYAAAEKLGIRAIIAPYAADTKPFAPTLDMTRQLHDKASRQGGRIQVWVGLHDLESCTDEQIRHGANLARSLGTGIHLHCSESSYSVELTRGRTGRTPVAHLHTLGALTERTILAHCVWVNGDDRRILQAHGAHVAHCPHANLKLGSGIAPIPELDADGVNITLATDGAKANNRLDMFDVMKFASLLHKGIARDPGLLPAPRILDMATRCGGQALGMRGLGIIDIGMPADLITVRCDEFHLQPASPETIVTNLVHAARGSDVSLVMVEGQVIVRDGVLLEDRGGDMRRQAREVGLSLLQRHQCWAAR